MIKEITVENWKSFEKATFYIDPLTILIGANASGKSNLLDTFLFLMRIASNFSISQAINGDVNLLSIRGGFEWVCRKPYDKFTITVIAEKSEKQDYQYVISCKVNDTKADVSYEALSILTQSGKDKPTREKFLFKTAEDESDSPGLPTYFNTGTQGRGKRVDLNRSHAILSQAETRNLRKEVVDAVNKILNELRSIFVFDPIPSHMRDYKPFSDTLQFDGSNIAGVLAGLESQRKEDVEKILTHYLKDLPEKDVKRVWTEPVGKFKTDAMLYCEEGWGTQKYEVDARGMSDGTLRYLAIVTALLTRKEHSLLIIEEIDNGLHPSRARILIDMLKTLGQKRNIDIVVTTHNPALLDALGNTMVPFITVVHRDNQTGSSLLRQLEDIEQLPKLMAGGTIGRLSTEGKIEQALKAEEAK
ncbi:MAG: AAA family ATPase [Desulfamplus sp.]|nr:AAA family ATPase [Desulfamplus sp.]